MITDHVPAVRVPPDTRAAWLRLSRREETWKTAEILILRHQLAVLQRRQPRRPKLNWADRALLAALLGVIPKARRYGLRLLVTPDTIVRWHRDIVRRRWAARSMPRQDRPTGHPPEHQGPGPPAGAGEPRMGLPQDPRGTGRPGSQGRGVDRMADPQDQRHRSRATTDRADLVAVPEFSGRGAPGVRLLQRRPARRHPGLRPDRDQARDTAPPPAPARSPCRGPVPEAHPASARPRRPHQRIRAGRIEAQARTGGRVLEPHT